MRLDNEYSAEPIGPDTLTTVFLLPIMRGNETGEKALKQHWRRIFEEMLVSWHQCEEDWPGRCSYQMFRQCFSVELQSVVFDLAGDPSERSH